MDFGDIFSRAWTIIWKYKILWIFGLLAGLAATGDSGSLGLRFNVENGGQLNQTAQGMPFWVIPPLLLAGLVILAAVITLSTVGRAGLMRGAWRADSGETGITGRGLFAESQFYFGRVLLLEVLLYGVGLTLLMILLVPTVLTLGLALLCLWPLFCLLVPAFLLLSVVFKLAIAAIVGEGVGVMEGVRRGWAVVRANPGQIIAIAIALILGSFVIAAIISAPLWAILAPVLAAWLAGTGVLVRASTIFAVMVLVVYLPVLLLLNGILVSYIDTVWTLAYRRLTGKAAGP